MREGEGGNGKAGKTGRGEVVCEGVGEHTSSPSRGNTEEFGEYLRHPRPHPIPPQTLPSFLNASDLPSHFRGVTEELGEYLRHLIYDKEQREYVAWLSKVRDFVK